MPASSIELNPLLEFESRPARAVSPSALQALWHNSGLADWATWIDQYGGPNYAELGGYNRAISCAFSAVV